MTTPAEILSLAGNIMFLLLACFDRIGRGGLQPLFHWAATHIGSTTGGAGLRRPAALDGPALMGLDFFTMVLSSFKPCIYDLKIVRQAPIILYTDAEWTVTPQLIKKGLGAILWDGDDVWAAACSCPDEVVAALHHRETQIIPLELLANAGALHTYGQQLRGREVIAFVDNQSVCAALSKGANRSHDIQGFTTAWHALANSEAAGCGSSGFRATRTLLTNSVEAVLLPTPRL